MATTLGPVRIGAAQSFTLGPLKDGTGQPLNYDGNETLFARIYQQGPGSAVLETPGIVWKDAADVAGSTITLSLVGTDSIDLTPGLYAIDAGVIESGQEYSVLEEASIRFIEMAGSVGATTTLDRAGAEWLLVRRCSGALKAADLDGWSFGRNPDLVDPILEALIAVGGSPTSPVTVADEDLSVIDATTRKQFLDIAEYRTLCNCLNNFNQVTWSSGGLKQHLSDFRKDLIKRVDQLRDRLEIQYGYNAGTAAGAAPAIDVMTGGADPGLGGLEPTLEAPEDGWLLP